MSGDMAGIVKSDVRVKEGLDKRRVDDCFWFNGGLSK